MGLEKQNSMKGVDNMVEVTRLNGSKLVINSDLIETLEETPDTVVTLTTGHKIIVTESIDDLIDRIVQYKQKISVLPILVDHKGQ